MANEKKIIRNPTPEEIKKLSQKEAVKAKSTKKNTSDLEIVDEVNKNVKIIPTQVLKESSVFEPAATKFKLPSGNIIVPGGIIYVRRMTTVEESIFQQTISNMRQTKDLSSKVFLESVNKVLDSCIKSKVSVYDLSLIDKIPLFVFIFSLTYGNNQEFDLMCVGDDDNNGCGKTFEHKIDLNKINIKYIPKKYTYPKIIELKKSFEFPITLELIYPSIGDENIWTLDVDGNDAVTKFLTMIKSANGTLPDGTEISEEHYEDIAKNLHPDDKEDIKKFINEFSEFGSNIKVKRKVCKDRKCSFFGKIQETVLPMESIFYKVF